MILNISNAIIPQNQQNWGGKFTATASTNLFGFGFVLINGRLVDHDRAGGVSRRNTGLFFNIKDLPPT
jgi:hypothetical protein